MRRAVIGLGGNLGARRALLRAACALLADQPGLRILARSQLYESPALGPPQPDYLNAAVLVEWAGSADALFAVTCHVEQLLGRERRERWGARTIDLDILLWSGGAVRSDRLRIPHPGLFERSFALLPLRDVMPGLAPEIDDCLARLSDHAHTLAPLAETPFLAAADEHLLEDTDPAELLCEAVSAATAWADPSTPCRSTVPFVVAGPIARAAPALLSQLELWANNGFLTVRAAVTDCGGESFRGVLLGAHTGASGHPPSLALRAEAGQEGAKMWVKVTRAAS